MHTPYYENKVVWERVPTNMMTKERQTRQTDRMMVGRWMEKHIEDILDKHTSAGGSHVDMTHCHSHGAISVSWGELTHWQELIDRK